VRPCACRGFFLSLIAILVTAGCAGGGLVRLDAAGTMESRDIGRTSGFPAATVVLDGVASIRKVVITPRRPLRKIEVLVRVPDGSWKSVKYMQGRFTRPVTVRVEIDGDAVRVLDRNPAAPVQRGPHVAGVTGAVENVLVYGRPSDAGAS
jgi:hypothetical protein